MNNTLKGISSRITEAEEWINDLGKEWWKSLPQNRVYKKVKRNEDSLTDLWDNIKCTNIHIIEVSKGGGRKDLRKYLKRK